MSNPFLHLARGVEQDETMAFRAFSNLNVPDNAEGNWDMDLETPPWLNEVHNQFVGKRAFLLGTGPSLLEQRDLLARLNDEHTFTCNRMAKWEEVPFTPWVHCVTEPGPFVVWGRGIASTYDFPGAVNKVGCCWFPVHIPGWNWLPKAPDDIQVRWQGVFGMDDFLPPIPTAWASPLTIAQLALWMGFTELYVLGCDMTDVGQAWDKEQGTTKIPRSVRSTVECADRIRSQMKLHGRSIVDCTPGGRLNVDGALEYVPLEEVLN